MTLNAFSVLMSILLFTIISTICSLFLSRTRSNHLWVIALILGLSFLRCIIPVEISGAFTINCWEIYPELFSAAQYELLNHITVEHLLFAVWLLGSFIVLFKQVSEIRQQVRLVKVQNAVPITPHFQAIADEAAKAVNCQKKVELYASPKLVSPVMSGFVKPVIVIPEHILFFNDQEIEHILRHEISHYKGGDIWIRLLIQLLVCILWWNPAVYLLRQSVIQLLELRCDDRACRTLTENARAEYTAVLIKSLKIVANKPKSALASCFVGNYYKAFIRQRIKVLLSPPPSKPALWKSLLTTSICILLFIGSYTFILQPAAAPPNGENEPSITTITPENAWLLYTDEGQYEVWVNGKYLATISAATAQSAPFNELQIKVKEPLP